MELNGATLNVNKLCVTSWKTAFRTALPDVWLKPDLYDFQSVKPPYSWNFGHMLKSYGFLVSNEIGNPMRSSGCMPFL